MLGISAPQGYSDGDGLENEVLLYEPIQEDDSSMEF
jgi:hypothetical protein